MPASSRPASQARACRHWRVTVLTDRVSELRGAIADDRARPAPDANVIVFSTDRDRWYPASRFLRTAVAGADGAFTIAGLPFGSYYAAAVARLLTMSLM